MVSIAKRFAPSIHENAVVHIVVNRFRRIKPNNIVPFSYASGHHHLTYVVGHSYSVPTPCKLSRLEAIYNRKGFKLDKSSNFASMFGVNKIAVWSNKKGLATHAALQSAEAYPYRGTQMWKSKLPTLQGLELPIVFHKIRDLPRKEFGIATYTFSNNWLNRNPLFGLNLIRTYYLGGTNNPLPAAKPTLTTTTLEVFRRIIGR
jgi:hypothetical protein